MEDRRAEASKMAQHSHEPQLLVPGTVVDIYRKPDRKDQYGWHGPAELVSVKRQAGSAIVDHQGQPLLVPLRHIRKHVLTALFHHFLEHDPDSSEFHFHCNPNLGRATHEVFLCEDFFDIKSDPTTDFARS